jgi:hypothetical protein
MPPKTKPQSRLDADVAARTALLERARIVLPTLTSDGKTDREIHEAVLHHMQPTLDLRGKSDAYVRSYFDAIAPHPTMPRLEQPQKPPASASRIAPKQDAQEYVDDNDVAAILAGKLPKSVGPQPRLDAIDSNDVHAILAGTRHNERVFDEEWAKPLDASTQAPAAARTAPSAAPPQRIDAGDSNDVHATLEGRHAPQQWPLRVYVSPPWTQPLASSRSKPRADASSSSAYRSPWRSPLSSSKQR